MQILIRAWPIARSYGTHSAAAAAAGTAAAAAGCVAATGIKGLDMYSLTTLSTYHIIIPSAILIKSTTAHLSLSRHHDSSH